MSISVSPDDHSVFEWEEEERPMQYVCLVYLEESTFEGMTDDEKRKVDRDAIDHDRALAESGHLIRANALRAPETAVTVRVRNGRMSTTDGPFAETKEHLGGFVIIEARDMNEAIAVAARIPLATMGSIEVRPVMTIGEWDTAAAVSA